MEFTKMQGCGNDYIYVDCFKESVPDPSELSIRLSDRHFGIGGDGLILIEPSEKSDCYMHMFNLDGSEGNMCGNGIRCTAKFIYDKGIVPLDRETVRIDTKSGIREVRLFKKDGKVFRASVDMGAASLTSELPENIKVSDMDLHFVGIDIGNPHAVYFLDINKSLGELKAIDFSEYGKFFECHERFPERVNSEFINVLSDREIDFRVYERGSGETLACGTGASAAVAAGCMMGYLKPDCDVTVHVKGGDLDVKYISSNGRCILTGPCEEVFTGRTEL